MSDNESPVISVKNLEKIYTGGVHAVKGCLLYTSDAADE